MIVSQIVLLTFLVFSFVNTFLLCSFIYQSASLMLFLCFCTILFIVVIVLVIFQDCFFITTCNNISRNLTDLGRTLPELERLSRKVLTNTNDHRWYAMPVEVPERSRRAHGFYLAVMPLSEQRDSVFLTMVLSTTKEDLP